MKISSIKYLFPLAFLSIVFFSSCQKELKKGDISDVTVIANAKEWFSHTAKLYPQIWDNNISKLNWAAADFITLSNREKYIIVPYTKYVFFKSTKLTLFRQVVIKLNFENKAESASVLETFTSKDYLNQNKKSIAKHYLNKNSPSFDGGFILYDVEYKTLSQSYFKNGKEVGKAKLKPADKSIFQRGNSNVQSRTESCSHYFFGIFYSDGTFEPLYYIGFLCNQEEGPNNEGPTPVDWANFGGDVSSGQDVVIGDTSIVNNYLVNCVYEKLIGSQMQYGLKSILSAFMDNNVYNLTFKLDDISSDGITNYLSNNTWRIRINRTNALDADYSRIWLASTIIHEAYHAKLRQYAIATFGETTIQNWPIPIDDMTLKELSDFVEQNAKSHNIWESVTHDWMVNHIDKMETSIREFTQLYYPIVYYILGTNSEAYRALAFSGLKESVLYQEKILANGLGTEYEALKAELARYGANACPL